MRIFDNKGIHDYKDRFPQVYYSWIDEVGKGGLALGKDYEITINIQFFKNDSLLNKDDFLFINIGDYNPPINENYWNFTDIGWTSNTNYTLKVYVIDHIVSVGKSSEISKAIDSVLKTNGGILGVVTFGFIF